MSRPATSALRDCPGRPRLRRRARRAIHRDSSRLALEFSAATAAPRIDSGRRRQTSSAPSISRYTLRGGCAQIRHVPTRRHDSSSTVRRRVPSWFIPSKRHLFRQGAPEGMPATHSAPPPIRSVCAVKKKCPPSGHLRERSHPHPSSVRWWAKPTRVNKAHILAWLDELNDTRGFTRT